MEHAVVQRVSLSLIKAMQKPFLLSQHRSSGFYKVVCHPMEEGTSMTSHRHGFVSPHVMLTMDDDDSGALTSSPPSIGFPLGLKNFLAELHFVQEAVEDASPGEAAAAQLVADTAADIAAAAVAADIAAAAVAADIAVASDIVAAAVADTAFAADIAAALVVVVVVVGFGSPLAVDFELFLPLPLVASASAAG